MMFIACYVLLFCTYLATCNSNKNLGLAVCSRDPLRCCPNYRLDDTFCKPCPLGTYGDSCSKECVYGFYGFGCLESCNCSRDQFCDAIIGCSYNSTSAGEDHEILHQILPVLLAIIFSVGSVLVIIVLLYNQRLKFLRKYVSELTTRRVSNNPSIQNSDEPQEDYSQMARASNSYNVLSFGIRNNAISTFNTIGEEDVYDEGGAIANRSDDFQDSYVSLALQRNQKTLAVEFEKNANSCVTKASDEKYGDSYVTLAVNQNEATANNANGTSNIPLMTSQTENSDTYDDTVPNFTSNYYTLEN